MSQAKTPLGDIPALYSLAANGDVSARQQLLAAYTDYINCATSELQGKYKTHLTPEDIFVDGVDGLLESLKSLELNSDCRTYAAWIEKNIRQAIEGRILEEIKISDGGGSPCG